MFENWLFWLESLTKKLKPVPYRKENGLFHTESESASSLPELAFKFLWNSHGYDVRDESRAMEAFSRLGFRFVREY